MWKKPAVAEVDLADIKQPSILVQNWCEVQTRCGKAYTLALLFLISEMGSGGRHWKNLKSILIEKRLMPVAV